MQATAQKFNRANATLQGFEVHGNFVDAETLLSIVHDDGFQDIYKKFCNEHLRFWRDLWWEFDRKIARYLNKNNKNKLKELHTHWIKETLSYFGYQDFQIQTADFADLGKACFYVTPDKDSHSVAVFVCNDSNVHSAFERGYALTDLEGETLFEDSIKESWTLAEQLEKTLKRASIAEAVLFLPQKIYWFRADSQLSGECLEVDLPRIMKADSENALVLASHVFGAGFFQYHEQQEQGEDGNTDRACLTESANLFKENLRRSREITEELHRQMMLALELLINERLAVDQQLSAQAQQATCNQKIADKLFDDALFVLYRILFVLFAEAKGYLPIHNKQYASFYSLDHFIDWAENYLKNEKRGIADPEGTYLWHALRALFTLMNKGIALHGEEKVSAYNGELFDDNKTPSFKREPCLRDGAMAKVLIALAKVSGDVEGQRWNFSSLGVEQIGAVYEALLSQQPRILQEDHVWVTAQGGGVGLVSCDFADKMQLEHCPRDIQVSSKKRFTKKIKTLKNYVQQQRPAFHPSAGKFVLAANSSEQKGSATFYTPPQLAKFLVEQTLQPLVKDKSYKEILKIRIIEPAVGCGSFLIAAVRYLARALLDAKINEQHLDIRGREATDDDRQKCKRIICEHCLHGVDVNYRATNLAIISLHLECIVKGVPLPNLRQQIKHGDSLLHADFFSDKLFDLPIDHLKIDKKIIAAYDDKCLACGKEAQGQALSKIFQQRLSKIKKERQQVGDWQAFKDKMQARVKTMLAELNSNREHIHYPRLKQLGNLWVALWFWPINKYHLFPSHADFKSICQHLLFSNDDLDARQQKILTTSAKLAKQHKFFHWQLEFPHIISKKHGFDALLCNPPWQVVGVKEKEIYPNFDPQFMNTSAADKEKRKQQLYNHEPLAARRWYRDTHFATSLSQFWKNAQLAAVIPEGKVDTCVLFTLLSGNLTKKSNRNGLLLSKSAVYTNKATKNLREYLFTDWGLEYGYAFVNTMGIFTSIDSRNQFTILIGERAKNSIAKFVDGIIDLDSLQKNLKEDAVSLSMQEIQRYFSKENLSIPSLSSQRLKETIIALQQTRGEALYLAQLAGVSLTGRGLNVTTSPQRGISQYREKIPLHELSTSKWIPLFKGKYFDYLQIKKDNAFAQYLCRSKTPAKVNLNNKTLVWRAIASCDNSRTLIVSILSADVWFDDSVWGIQFSNEALLYRLATLWSTMVVDVCVRLIGGVNVNMGYVSNIPIPCYDSFALQEAVHIYRKNFDGNNIKQARAKIEALIWLHYGGSKAPLDGDGLRWLMESQFPLVSKNEPDYVQQVLAAYDVYSKDKKYICITDEAFTKKLSKQAA